MARRQGKAREVCKCNIAVSPSQGEVFRAIACIYIHARLRIVTHAHVHLDIDGEAVWMSWTSPRTTSTKRMAKPGYQTYMRNPRRQSDPAAWCLLQHSSGTRDLSTICLQRSACSKQALTCYLPSTLPSLLMNSSSNGCKNMPCSFCWLTV